MIKKKAPWLKLCKRILNEAKCLCDILLYTLDFVESLLEGKK